ncbi:MAG: DUF4097 domain-containing protein [Candidatus Aminicenantes bacterium]|nr:DUF4097 domain-containing protein [Candidatus Aminicenantes bacterium]MDH5707392.1 DUF4097 domain-containing protein [Candidatus Aminicenantes bacterium]
MKRTKIIISLFVFLSFMVSAALLAAPEEKVDKTFGKKDEIRFKLVLGDCQLKKSSDGSIHVHLVYSYEPDMSFEPLIRERGGTLYLEEKMRGNNPKGYSTWTVEVPDDIEIEFKSATGSLTVEGLKIEIDGSTGTGDIELSQVKGEFDLSTGTGDVEAYDSEGEFELSSGTGNVKIKNCKGNFDASSGTGDVKAEGLTLELDGEFSSGTGDAEVSFPDGTDFELKVSSGTDDAILDMNGKQVKGYFEFTCHARRGRIVCPVKFDKEEEYKDNDQTYLRKSFTQGKDVPKVYVKTGTGTARLNK